DLQAGSDTGVSNGDNLTSTSVAGTLTFDVALAEPASTVQLLRDGNVVNSRTGPGPITDPGPGFTDGPHQYTTQQVDLAGNVGRRSAALAVTIDTTPPGITSAPDLEPSSDTGTSSTDNVTSDTEPVFDVSGLEANATLELLRNGVVVAKIDHLTTGSTAIQD